MNDSDRTAISTLSYISVEKIAHWYDQKIHSSIHHIHLYEKSISTAIKTFHLEHIHDISYRPFSGGTGLFYLHTNQGVFTFKIDADPSDFITAYKNIR